MALVDVAEDTFRQGFKGLPPQSIECEEAVLGAILLDPNAINRAFDILTPEMFYISAHQEIYRAAVYLKVRDRPVDFMQVALLLQDQERLERVGGKTALARLVDMTIGSYSVELHAQVVKEKYQRRKLIEIGFQLSSSAHDGKREWSEIIEEAQKAVFDLTPSAQERGLQPISDILAQEMTAIENRSAGEKPGVLTDFYDFDEKVRGGLKPGQLVIVAGRPSMGKSAWAMAVASNVAAQGKPVAVFSLEMSNSELAQRLLSGAASIASDRLGSGEINPEEWVAIGRGCSEVCNLPLHLDESSNVTPSHVLTQCRSLKAREGGLGLVVIDYLHLMLDGDEDDVKELGKITRACKRMARSLEVPVMLLSQLSRAVENRQNKRPMMSDLRSSGAIEQDADLIAMLYRDEYYNPETADRGIAEVLITKNRNGATGTARLLFEPQFTRFRNLIRR